MDNVQCFADTMIRKTLPGPTAHGLCICRAPVAPAQSRRYVSMRADQTPDKSSAASSSATSSQPTEPSDNPFSLSQVVGSYGIIGLFTSALVLAGYKGFQAVRMLTLLFSNARLCSPASIYGLSNSAHRHWPMTGTNLISINLYLEVCCLA